MRSIAATRRLIALCAFLLALGWAGLAHAQLAVGTTWVADNKTASNQGSSL